MQNRPLQPFGGGDAGLPPAVYSINTTPALHLPSLESRFSNCETPVVSGSLAGLSTTNADEACNRLGGASGALIKLFMTSPDAGGGGGAGLLSSPTPAAGSGFIHRLRAASSATPPSTELIEGA